MTTKLSHLRTLFEKNSLDALLISSPDAITYFTDFSGFSKEDRDAYLLITQKEQYIFTHGIYEEAVQKYIKGYTLLPITREDPFTKQLQTFLQKHRIKKIGFEAHNLSVAEYLQIKKYTKDAKMTAADKILFQLRMYKTVDEQEKLKAACALGDKAFTYICKHIKLGMTEKQLAFLLESYIKEQGADISFPTIAAFGKNSSLPHHQTGTTKLAANDFVLLDFGIKLDNYCSDMTRTLVYGKASKKQKDIYEAVFHAQENAMDYLSNHAYVSASEVDAVARNYIVQKDFPTIPHSLGHGIGLAVHEPPHLAPHSPDMLIEGMVFSLEPGIYIPDFGGVRIEDLVLKTKTGSAILTHSPKDLIEV